MGKSHTEQLQLAKQLADAQSIIGVGAKYWHYKSRNKVYKVVGLGFLEANDELCVIYESQYGEPITFLRPLTSWLDTVEWQGEVLPRFTKIKP